ncbi:hypothetical protein [Streptomyces triculaminicus]|uniref:hypothetical protein n=1 Tax=Streptomyces triculaminicus TaxID=2816232 RepID=UPI0037CE50EC
MYRRPLQALLYSLFALVVACGGALAGAPAARAAAACAPNTASQGRASVPSGDPVPVRRADGRVDEFRLFYEDPTPSVYLPFVWHRAQDEPGGPYGAWERVSATPVGPKYYQITAAEDAAGRIEVFFQSSGPFCHVVEGEHEGEWSPAEWFGLNPGPYHGGIVLFKERDGRLDAFASAYDGDSMRMRDQDPVTGQWGPVRGLGTVPDPNVGLSHPSSVTQLPDGRLRLVVREWNRDRFWQITERERFVSWEPWRLCATQDCA